MRANWPRTTACISITCIVPIPKDRNYLTAYRYLIFNLRMLKTLKKMPGNKQLGSWYAVPFWYGVMNFLLVACVMLPTIAYFKWEEAMIVWGLLMVYASLWNGANYYVEVFSKKYEKELDKERQRLRARRVDKQNARLATDALVEMAQRGGGAAAGDGPAAEA